MVPLKSGWVVKTNGIPFWGGCIHHPFWSILDVQWGYDLAFDPWPSEFEIPIDLLSGSDLSFVRSVVIVGLG